MAPKPGKGGAVGGLQAQAQFVQTTSAISGASGRARRPSPCRARLPLGPRLANTPPPPSPPEGPSRVESQGGNVGWGDAHSKSSLGRRVGRSKGVTARAGSAARLAAPRSPQGVPEIGPRACPVPGGRQPLALHWWGVLSDTGHAIQGRWGTCSES